MDDQFEVRQVDAARRHIRSDADARTPVAQGLQGAGAFVLAQLPREADNQKAPVRHACCQAGHGRARIGKDDGRGRIVEPQHVDDRVFGVMGGDLNRLIADVAVLPLGRLGLDPLGVALEFLGHLLDSGWHSGREHQGAAIFGRFAQHEL